MCLDKNTHTVGETILNHEKILVLLTESLYDCHEDVVFLGRWFLGSVVSWVGGFMDEVGHAFIYRHLISVRFFTKS
mgnify:CR=1 FL=1